MRIKWATIAVLSLVVIMTGAVACNPFAKESTVTQQVVEVTRGNLVITIEGDGNIESSRTMKLSFGTSGKINKIYFKEGDKVGKGAILAKLDTSALELARSQAQVAVSQTQLSLTQAQLSLTQAQLALTQAQLASQTADYELERTQDRKDALNLALFKAEIDLRTAKYALDKAKDVYRWPEVEGAQAEVDKARAHVDYATQRLSEASTAMAIETWNLALARARATLDAAEAKLKAQVEGYDKEEVAIKKLQVDAAEMAVTQAKKSVNDLTKEVTIKKQQADAAKESVAQANQSVAYAKQSVAHTKQSLDFAQQSLAQAQKNLDEAILTAPFDGVVTSIPAEEGDTVASTTIIIHLVDLANLELHVDLDEIDVPNAKLNQDVLIAIDALPDTKLNGKVALIYPIPTNVGGVVLYEVKISFNVPPDSAVKVGMSASADIIVNKRDNVLLIPSRAIEERQGKSYVKVTDGAQVQERPVVTGVGDGTQTEIVSGLSEGEKVVIGTRAKSSSSGGIFGS